MRDPIVLHLPAADMGTLLLDWFHAIGCWPAAALEAGRTRARRQDEYRVGASMMSVVASRSRQRNTKFRRSHHIAQSILAAVVEYLDSVLEACSLTRSDESFEDGGQWQDETTLVTVAIYTITCSGRLRSRKGEALVIAIALRSPIAMRPR